MFVNLTSKMRDLPALFRPTSDDRPGLNSTSKCSIPLQLRIVMRSTKMLALICVATPVTAMCRG